MRRLTFSAANAPVAFCFHSHAMGGAWLNVIVGCITDMVQTITGQNELESRLRIVFDRTK